METVIHLDTHVIVWLYSEGGSSLPSTVANRIEQCDSLVVSPAVHMELQYLYEIGRVTLPAQAVMEEMTASLGVEICNASFLAVVLEAGKLSWTRDPFDRLIVAQASLRESTLVTKDSTILSNYPHAVWD